MQKRVQITVILFLSLLFVVGLYLLAFIYVSKKTELIEKPQSEAGVDIPLGELGVDKIVNPVAPFEQTVINNVWVIGFRKYTNEDNSVLVDLDLGYKQGNTNSVIKLTLAGETEFAEYTLKSGKGNFEQKDSTSVDLLPFVKGEFATITLAYFKGDETEDFSKKLSVYCSLVKDTICKDYPSLGFGTAPINGDFTQNYLNKAINVLSPTQFAVLLYTRNLVIPPMEL